MSSKYSNTWRRVALSVALPSWVFLGFILAQALLLVLVSALQFMGGSFGAVNPFLLNTILSVVIYMFAISLVIGVPWLVKRYRTTRTELGLQRAPNWLDFAWLPLGAVVYFVLSALLTSIALLLFPFFDSTQAQDTGFAGISGQFEYILAFIALVVVAPFAEEVLFRGYLFGKLRKYAPVWVAVLITSLVFAVVHFQWNVGVDVFALSIVLCVLRIITGSLWPAIFLHMAKNGLAFYFLFINPLALGILG